MFIIWNMLYGNNVIKKISIMGVKILSVFWFFLLVYFVFLDVDDLGLWDFW